ncbi:MAG: hypothetical protein ACRELF_07440 [Gemmataceae bacterium]
MSRLLRALSIIALILIVGSLNATREPSATPYKHVLLVRTPDGGIQPQAVEHKGIHLIYFKGDAKGGDVYYVKGQMRGEKPEFSKPLRVNSQRGSVLALGNIRGAQLAIGHGGRAHVAWVGSSKAEPKASGGQTPMLYSRLNDDGTAFEPQRNLVHEAVGVEGGSLAADGQEIQVYWHAPEPSKRGEGHRRVWMIESHDGGTTFPAKEKAISPADTGVCGCCGMRAINRIAGSPAVLYRSATDGVHRDTYFLHLNDRKTAFDAVKLDAWETEMCPMSTFGLHGYHKGWLAAWETKGQVYCGHIERSGKLVRRFAAPGKGGKRKHPVVCSNGSLLLLAWTEGMEWGKGGAVAWQLYDGVHEDKDTPRKNTSRFTSCSGRVDGVPPWSLLTAARVSDSRFVIFY